MRRACSPGMAGSLVRLIDRSSRVQETDCSTGQCADRRPSMAIGNAHPSRGRSFRTPPLRTRPCPNRAGRTVALVAVVALSASLMNAGSALAQMRVVGPDVADRGWPSRTTTRPGAIEAYSGPAGVVRALPLTGEETSRITSAERAAARSLARTLRSPASAVNSDADEPNAGFGNASPDSVNAANRGERLRPQEINFEPSAAPWFDAPEAQQPAASAGDAPNAQDPDEAARRPSAVAPRGAEAPIPQPRPERSKSMLIGPQPESDGVSADSVDQSDDGVPLPRPAPLGGGPMRLVNAEGAAAIVQRPERDRPAVTSPTARAVAIPRPVPWARTAAARSARAATVTPFLGLWPSSQDSDGSADAPDEADAGSSGDGRRAETADPADRRDVPRAGQTLYGLTRLLTALQDDIARGAGSALDAQKVLQTRLAERFEEARPEQWEDPRNARALIIYALSGGRPDVVRYVSETAVLAPPYGSLVKGALAYVEGRAGDARGHFATAGPERLDASLAGPVHLARAALVVDSDPARALDLLAQARVAAPGSLIEEASLRRALLVAAEMDQLATVEGHCCALSAQIQRVALCRQLPQAARFRADAHERRGGAFRL